MKKMDFNQDWLFWKEGAGEKKQIVALPHDAMIHEKRDPKCLNAKTTGFFREAPIIMKSVSRFRKTGAAGKCWRSLRAFTRMCPFS